MNDEEFNILLDKLINVVTELHHRWKIYREVYASDPENFDLLNKFGPNFFHYAQYLMLDHIALAFSKLTDPNRQGNKENLSLKQVHVYASDRQDNQLVTDLKVRFELLVDNCQKFRLLRNKRIAHADLEHGLGRAREALPGLSRKYVEDALHLLREYINTVQLHYRNSQTLYTEIVVAPGSGGDGVIKALRIAHRNA